MKNFDFVEGKNGINFNEWLYLKDMFKLLKCGVELEFEYSDELDLDRSDIREAIGRMNSNYETFGICTNGVATVTSDGSLENGSEVVTNGRLFHTPYLHYCQYRNIFNALEWEIERNPRTGLHMHFVIATGDGRSNLEIPLNLTFMKNFMILCKKYLPQMVYLTSSNYKVLQNGNTSITRYSGFSKYNTLYDVNFNEINTVRDFLSRYANRDGRYQCINLQSMDTGTEEYEGTRQEVMRNFHVEFRLADGALCPSQVTLIQFMYKGLIDLALECSLIGELKDVYSYNKDLLAKFKNNPSGSDFPRTDNRYSDNTLTDAEYNRLKFTSKTFIDDIKDYIGEEIVRGLELIVDSPIGKMSETLGDDFKLLDDSLNVFNVNSGIIKHDVIKTLLSIDTTSLSEVLLTSKEKELNLEEVNNTINLLKQVERFGGKSW